MSKRQPDGVLERFTSVAKTAGDYPELVRLWCSPGVQKFMQALELTVRDATGELLTSETQSNTAATKTEIQQLPPPVNEQSQVFISTPLWMTIEEHSMEFMPRLSLEYPSPWYP